MKVYIHFIDEKSGKLLFGKLTHYAPSVGDEIRYTETRYTEIRYTETRFYRVKHLVWVYDEEDHPYERLNAGVELVKLG